jgi:AraC-like DNA-binding protein
LNLLHQNPAKNWTVAAEVGMSRSPFAAKFTRLVGEPILQYLTKWRMNLAADYLMSNELSIGKIANKVGYETIAAFSKNFKKHFGLSPREYRITQKANN